MDALNLFPGVNIGMVAGIIGVLLGVKAIAQGKLPSWFYIAAVMALGFVSAALVVSPFQMRGWIISGIAHAGAASILYQFGKMLIPVGAPRP